MIGNQSYLIICFWFGIELGTRGNWAVALEKRNTWSMGNLVGTQE